MIQDEGWRVEFAITEDESGKPKAEDVTAPGGGNCSGPKKPRRRRRKSKAKGGGDGAVAGENEEKKVTQPQPHWHEKLTDAVKASLDAKDIVRTAGTLDVASGSARIKLGTKGYTSLAHSDGILAEGAFECDADGNVSFTWDRALTCDNGEWKAGDADASELPSSLSLVDGKYCCECAYHFIRYCII